MIRAPVHPQHLKGKNQRLLLLTFRETHRKPLSVVQRRHDVTERRRLLMGLKQEPCAFLECHYNSANAKAARRRRVFYVTEKARLSSSSTVFVTRCCPAAPHQQLPAARPPLISARAARRRLAVRCHREPPSPSPRLSDLFGLTHMTHLVWRSILVT